MALQNSIPQSGGSGMFAYTFGACVLAFVVYVAAKGELPTYLNFFLIPATAPVAAAASSGASTTPAASAQAAANGAGIGAN